MWTSPLNYLKFFPREKSTGEIFVLLKEKEADGAYDDGHGCWMVGDESNDGKRWWWEEEAWKKNLGDPD